MVAAKANAMIQQLFARVFPNHAQAEAASQTKASLEKVRQVLVLKVNKLAAKKSGYAIAVTPGVVEKSFLPIVMCAYPGAIVFVVGADGKQERAIAGMKPEGWGVKAAKVELVKDAAAFKAALKMKEKKLGVPMEVSGIFAPGDVLADALRQQIPDMVPLTDEKFQRLQSRLSSVLQRFVTAFRAALSREQSA